jgi:hypothetical protein
MRRTIMCCFIGIPGLALYTTRARERDIHLANHKLSVAGERLRYVPAKFFMNHSLVG